MAQQGLGEAHPDATKTGLPGPSLLKCWPKDWPLMNAATCRAGCLLKALGNPGSLDPLTEKPAS